MRAPGLAVPAKACFVVLAAVGGLVAPLALAAPHGTSTTIKIRGTDRGLVASKLSAPAGEVVFSVSNRGSRAYVFGASTRGVTVEAGKSATLTLTFSSARRLTLSWRSGSRVVASTSFVITAAAPGTATTTATTTAPTVLTTVQVSMFEYGYTLSSTTVPAGKVVFQLTNTGSQPHDFAVQGAQSGRSATLAPGGSGTLTMTLTPGAYIYVCTLPGHAQEGMQGTLTVSG